MTGKLSILSAIALLIAFTFQNCGESFQAIETYSQSSFCKTQPKRPSPFAEKKNHLNLGNKNTLQKLNNTPTKAALVINTQCYFNLDQDTFFLNNKIELPEKYHKMKSSSYPIDIPPHLSNEDIDKEIEQSNCIIGIAENTPIFKSQTTVISPPTDPQVKNQAHLSFLGYYQSLLLQSEITQKVVVAIIDTGVDYNHDDLKNRIWQSINGSRGINTIGSISNSVMDDDSAGHGTHLAGIIAAEGNNGSQGVGLTDSFVEIMIVKALDSSGAGSAASVSDGIEFAIANGADVINLSLQAPGTNAVLEAAVNNAINAGILVTVSAGNEGEHITANNIFMPAYLGPKFGGVLSITSVDSDNGNISSYSNYGSTYTEMGAPGSQNSMNLINGGILSTTPGNNMTRVHGTSQASPMVAAAAAMVIGYLKTKNINYTPAAIESFIKTNGSAKSQSLSSFISDGNILHFGLLAQNLSDYVNNSSNTTPDLNGNTTVGNTCFVK